MKRPVRIAVYVAVALALTAAALFAGFWALQRALSTEKLTVIIERAASDFLERPLTIEHLERPLFPLTELVARGVLLKEKSGEVIVECPEVHARASLRSLLLLRLGVDEMTFHDARIHIRFRKDGQTNVEGIVNDIMKRPTSPVRTSVGALVFHRFVILRASVTVSNAKGVEIEPARSVANGWVAIKITPLGVSSPYSLELDGGEGRMRVRTSGRFASSSPGELVFERLPAVLLAPRFTALAACEGRTDGRFSWSGDANSEMSFAVSPSNLCGADALPSHLSGVVSKKYGQWLVTLDGLGTATEAHLAGRVPVSSGTIVWTLTAPRLDALETAGWVSRASDIFGTSNPASVRIAPLTFSARVGKLTAGRLPFENVVAEVRRSTDGVMHLDPVSAKLFGGPVQGTGQISKGTVRLDATGTDLDLGQAAKTFQSTSPLTGQLAVHLKGAAPVGHLLDGFGGDVSLNLTDGRIPEVPAVLKTLTSANLVKLAHDLRGEKSEGIQITQGEASATLSGGVADVNHLMLDSRVLRIGFKGKIDLIAQKITGTVVLQPLNLADQIINDIPVLRTLLLGDSKTFLPLWFGVKGPWNDPRVRSMPVRSLEAPVKNVLEGILKFPQRAYDALRGKKS